MKSEKKCSPSNSLPKKRSVSFATTIPQRNEYVTLNPSNVFGTSLFDYNIARKKEEDEIVKRRILRGSHSFHTSLPLETLKSDPIQNDGSNKIIKKSSKRKKGGNPFIDVKDSKATKTNAKRTKIQDISNCEDKLIFPAMLEEDSTHIPITSQQVFHPFQIPTALDTNWLTVLELKRELSTRALPVFGNKASLRKRLEKALKES